MSSGRPPPPRPTAHLLEPQPRQPTLPRAEAMLFCRVSGLGGARPAHGHTAPRGCDVLTAPHPARQLRNTKRLRPDGNPIPSQSPAPGDSLSSLSTAWVKIPCSVLIATLPPTREHSGALRGGLWLCVPRGRGRQNTEQDGPCPQHNSMTACSLRKTPHSLPSRCSARLKQEPQGPRGCTAGAAQGLLQHLGVKGRAQATSQSASGCGALGLPASSTSHSHTVR